MNSPPTPAAHRRSASCCRPHSTSTSARSINLSLPLRLFEGCARGLIGRVDGANLIKLNRTEPKISYPGYPEFETSPHLALALSVTVHLQTFRVKYWNYRRHRNPPILHREEAFLYANQPLYNKFARLMRIEESKGLYEETSRIGTRECWNAVSVEKALTFRGHQLIRQSEKLTSRPPP